MQGLVTTSHIAHVVHEPTFVRSSLVYALIPWYLSLRSAQKLLSKLTSIQRLEATLTCRSEGQEVYIGLTRSARNLDDV
jgi:hypothetical protein